MPIPEKFFGFFFSKDTMGDMLYDNTAEEIIEICRMASEKQEGSHAFYIAASIHDLIANSKPGDEEIKAKVKELFDAGFKIKPDAPWQNIIKSGARLREDLQKEGVNFNFLSAMGAGIQNYCLIMF